MISHGKTFFFCDKCKQASDPELGWASEGFMTFCMRCWYFGISKDVKEAERIKILQLPESY